MITPCPHGFTQIELDPVTHSTLADQSDFACLVCKVAVDKGELLGSRAAGDEGINWRDDFGNCLLEVIGGVGIRPPPADGASDLSISLVKPDF